jgi:hypothetical protein
MLYDSILLEPEQKKLLSELVETSRSIPSDAPYRKFIHTEFSGGTSVLKNRGLPNWHTSNVYRGNLDILNRNGLLSLTINSQRGYVFDVTPEGFKYYEEMKMTEGEPIQRIQSSVKDYLDSNRFQKNYPCAYKKWLAAEQLLWSTETNKQLSVVGHNCREAMQEFVTTLVESLKPNGVEQDKAKHIIRLKAVIAHRSTKLGKTLPKFLNALIEYWGTVSDLVQRQEHAGQKEGEPVTWEDARRVVFQTAITMYEIDRAFSSTN